MIFALLTLKRLQNEHVPFCVFKDKLERPVDIFSFDASLYICIATWIILRRSQITEIQNALKDGDLLHCVQLDGSSCKPGSDYSCGIVFITSRPPFIKTGDPFELFENYEQRRLLGHAGGVTVVPHCYRLNVLRPLPMSTDAPLSFVVNDLKVSSISRQNGRILLQLKNITFTHRNDSSPSYSFSKPGSYIRGILCQIIIGRSSSGTAVYTIGLKPPTLQ